MDSEDRLSPARRLLIGAFAVGLAGIAFAAGRIALRPVPDVPQPIQFNHQKHVAELELECSVCHEYYETSAHSGLPALTVCLGCHEGGLGDSAEEKTLLALAAQDPPPSFRKLFRLPDHTYYSHRRHVKVAGLACELCHGKVQETTRPPARPLLRITMDGCLDCHEKRGVDTGCAHCHR